MLTICWAAKGGSGTTVFAAARALSSPRPTLLVDLAGDASTVLGLTGADLPGVHDWLRSEAAPSRLVRLEQGATSRLSVIAAGAHHPSVDASGRWVELARHLRAESRDVIVDAGTGRPPGALLEVADERLLVTRQCYVALRHAVAQGVVPTGVVVVEEPGRALDRRDIEASLGVPVVATALLDPAIARAVDAGLLVSRLPATWRKQLVRHVVEAA